MNPTITAVIVDDEALSVSVIKALLKAFPEIELIATFTKSTQAAAQLPELKPELLFLDVQMPALDGFELLSRIEGSINPYVIFTTAFDQYAIRAFEVNAIGYLLKPFDKDKFELAVRKFLDRYRSTPKEEHLYSDLLQLLRDRQTPAAQPDRIMIRESRRIFYLPVPEVCYFEASGDYVKVVTPDKTHLINDSLTALEQRLPQGFVRIHRSFIINTDMVTEFLPYFNGEYKVVMRNKDIVKLSRSYKENLTRIFPEL